MNEIKHNGNNTNLYCDGRLYLVTGCPACDKAYKETMKPRWERARILSDELGAAGISNLTYHADLWKISAQGVLGGREIKVEEVQRT